jgi:hypothetical protein
MQDLLDDRLRYGKADLASVGHFNQPAGLTRGVKGGYPDVGIGGNGNHCLSAGCHLAGLLHEARHVFLADAELPSLAFSVSVEFFPAF